MRLRVSRRDCDTQTPVCDDVPLGPETHAESTAHQSRPPATADQRAAAGPRRTARAAAGHEYRGTGLSSMARDRETRLGDCVGPDRRLQLGERGHVRASLSTLTRPEHGCQNTETPYKAFNYKTTTTRFFSSSLLSSSCWPCRGSPCSGSRAPGALGAFFWLFFEILKFDFLIVLGSE